MSKTTAGQWKYDHNTGEITSSEGYMTIAQTPVLRLIQANAPQRLIKEAEANGRLIAEAKELLETMQGLHKALSRMIDKHDPDSPEAEWLSHSNEIIHRLQSGKIKPPTTKGQGVSL
jgi:hypothetical protein